MWVRSCAAIVAICLSGAALAQDAGHSAPPAPAREKKICRISVPTGTIMAKRTCRTRAEWLASDDRDERNAETFRDNKRVLLPPDQLE